jgi:biopolymer transport protein ExbD
MVRSAVHCPFELTTVSLMWRIKLMLASRVQSDELPVINMTPMVDVILCLLVFFMAATRLYDWDESEFVVNVPEVIEAAPATAAPDDLVLSVIKSGSVSVGESTYNLDQLVKFLTDARAQYINQGVVIRGDATLAYQDLADVLSACDEAGIRNVRLPVRSRDRAAKTP